MSAWFTGFAVYFVLWWLTLFIVLPYGNRSQAEEGVVIEGTDPGAPSQSRIWTKLFWNTVVSALVFAVYWWGSGYFGWEFSDIPLIIPEKPPE
ncbi:MAG: DUF1467 family protein [Pseudomonadota bacterium]